MNLKNSYNFFCFLCLQCCLYFVKNNFPFPIGYFSSIWNDSFFLSLHFWRSLDEPATTSWWLTCWLVGWLISFDFTIWFFFCSWTFFSIFAFHYIVTMCVCTKKIFKKKSHLVTGSFHMEHTHTHTVLVHLLDLFRIVVHVDVFFSFGKWEFECQIH